MSSANFLCCVFHLNYCILQLTDSFIYFLVSCSNFHCVHPFFSPVQLAFLLLMLWTLYHVDYLYHISVFSRFFFFNKFLCFPIFSFCLPSVSVKLGEIVAYSFLKECPCVVVSLCSPHCPVLGLKWAYGIPSFGVSWQLPPWWKTGLWMESLEPESDVSHGFSYAQWPSPPYWSRCSVLEQKAWGLCLSWFHVCLSVQSPPGDSTYTLAQHGSKRGWSESLVWAASQASPRTFTVSCLCAFTGEYLPSSCSDTGLSSGRLHPWPVHTNSHQPLPW